jgi:hypothetical protein
MRWRHVIISTVNSWLPGDPRGFRSRHHKVHSSGDYKNPPPRGEHEELFHYSKEISADPVVIPRDQRRTAGRAILHKLQKLNYRVLALAVAGMHAHVLVELPDNLLLIRHIIGQCKTVSSHAIRDRVPGRVWGAGGGFKPVDDEKHHRNVFHYILRQSDAWTWSFKDKAADPKPQGESSSPGGTDTPP